MDVRIKVRFQLFTACCPSCGSREIRPGFIRPWVERTFFRLWLLLSMRRPFICSSCDERFYDFRFKTNGLMPRADINSILGEYAPDTEVSAPDTPAAARQGRTA